MLYGTGGNFTHSQMTESFEFVSLSASHDSTVFSRVLSQAEQTVIYHKDKQLLSHPRHYLIHIS